MSISLRGYQIKLIQDIYSGWSSGYRNVMAVSPTGSGKAFTLCTLAEELAYSHRMETTIKVHRKELVSQLCMSLAKLGVYHNVIAQKNTVLDIIEQERREYGSSYYQPNSPITVVSVDTLLSRKEKYKEWGERQKVWILDEAAHQLKDNKWGKATEIMPNAIGVGFTATPQRLDKKGLGRHAFGLFDVMVQGPTVRYLIDNGFLSRYKVVVPPSQYREYLKEDGNDSKDYTHEAREYASIHSGITGDVVDNYIKFINGKQAIVFADSIKAGMLMEANFAEKGIAAKLLTGDTPDKERAKGVTDYRDGKIKVLINVDLFDEGFDCLSDDTEILTPNGWKDVNTIKNETHCYAWCPETKAITTQKINKYMVRLSKPDEKFWTVKSQHQDIKVTEGHRIYFRKNTNYAPTQTNEFNVLRAADLHNTFTRFDLPISGNYNFKGVDLKDDELRLIAWSLTDGYVGKDGALYLDQCKPNNIIKIKTILDNLKLKYSQRSSIVKSGYKPGISLTKFRISRMSIKYMSHLFDRRYIIYPELHDMTRNQFKVFWSSLMDGDGSQQEGKSGKLCVPKKEIADSLMQMAILRGFTPQCGYYKTKSGLQIYNLGLKDKEIIQLNTKDNRGAEFKLETIEQPEKVWCVSNDVGTIVTRRNGKVAILGNCPGTDAVIMARPTKSLSKVLQMQGRALRPVFIKGSDLTSVEGRLTSQRNGPKPHAFIIDHVGNIKYHQLPDKIRRWTLDNIVKKRERVNLIRICGNTNCNSPFDRALHQCPFCGHEDHKSGRAGGERSPKEALEMVDGDLELLDPEMIRQLEREIDLEDPDSIAERVTKAAGPIAGKSARKKQLERIEMQKVLSQTIAEWAGIQKQMHRYSDRSIKKKFYNVFDETITVALSLTRSDMEIMNNRIRGMMWD